MTLIAIIPARKGSKGLPGKNTRLLSGKPLIAHTIKSAIDSQVFSSIYVTSDDDRVHEIASDYNVISIRRPQELATDMCEMFHVINHVADYIKSQNLILGEGFALLQPTSPLRTPKHIKDCKKIFDSGNYYSVVSVCKVEAVPEKMLRINEGSLKPVVDWSSLGMNRQKSPQIYMQNGVVWMVYWKAFERNMSFVIPPAAPYEMSSHDSIDIDTIEDFQKVESIIAKRTIIIS